MAMNNAAAGRGKYAEKKVQEILDSFNSRSMNFTFNRCLDAHAAGGRFPAQAGDFQAFVKGTYSIVQREDDSELVAGIQMSRNFIIEVKEVTHDRLLPPKNYTADKVARVQKRVLAGTEAIVVVLHKAPAYVWRLVPFGVFVKRPEKGSWDLSAHPTYLDLRALEAALGQWMGVK